MKDSRKLLGEYVQTGSEPAFHGLLTNYVDLVYSAAVRLVGGDKHLAEDVSQTVFVDLAKMARTLPPDVMLGGWLHRHTCFVAATIRRSERRRQARERQAIEMNAANDQLRELMRLRGEVGALHRQLAEATKGREKSVPRPQPNVGSQDQQQQIAIARMRDAKVWVFTFYKYAADHQGQVPTSFDQVADYLDAALRNDLNPGEALRDKEEFAQSTNQFEIVYQGLLNDITNQASTIVMREKEAWQSSDGGWHRTYGFADGHTEIHKAGDGNFGLWESQHLQAAGAQ
jgi:DNA-directed RNA polymerase specialized sigma24 family protein